MMRRRMINILPLLFLLFLAACGGGSTVTAVSLTAQDNQVAVGGRTTLTARAEASVTGNVQGENVSFFIRHNESGSRLDVVSSRLDANGEATAIFHAGPRQGTDIVEASFASGARATTTIQVGGGVVVGNIRLEVFSDTGDGSHTGWRIRAIVTDTRGYPASGVTVAFSTNNGTLTVPSIQTNDAGHAETVVYDLPAGQGARVWATAGGITVSVNVGPRS